MEFCKKRKNKYINIRPFSLQELSRSKILGTGITEEGITQLEIPIKLKRQLMGQGSLQHEIPDLIEWNSWWTTRRRNSKIKIMRFPYSFHVCFAWWYLNESYWINIQKYKTHQQLSYFFKTFLHHWSFVDLQFIFHFRFSIIMCCLCCFVHVLLSFCLFWILFEIDKKISTEAKSRNHSLFTSLCKTQNF